MVLRRLEDGVEVEGVHPQAFQVVQLVDDPLKVPAEEVPVAHLAPVVGAVLGELLPALVDPAAPHQPLRIGDLAAAETVGEDLIGHPLAKPGGDFLRPVIDRELIGAQVLGPAVQLDQTEGVPDQSHIAGGIQLGGKQILAQVVALPGHFQDDGFVVPALEPGRQTGVGEGLRPGRTEGELHLRSRGHCAVRGFVTGISGIVGWQIWHWYHSAFRVGISGNGSSRRR